LTVDSSQSTVQKLSTEPEVVLQLSTVDCIAERDPGANCRPEWREHMDELKKAVRDYVVKEYLEDGDDREVREDTPLITGGIVDSFSMVSLKRFLERKYSIQIPDAQATPQAFDTVNSIADLVRKFTNVV